MRATQYYAPTLRQAPAEAEIPSHKLLVRGGDYAVIFRQRT